MSEPRWRVELFNAETKPQWWKVRDSQLPAQFFITVGSGAATRQALYLNDLEDKAVELARLCAEVEQIKADYERLRDADTLIIQARADERDALRAENERLREALENSAGAFHAAIVLSSRGTRATLHGDNHETLEGCLHETCRAARAALGGKE